ncbi:MULTISPECIES: acyl-CoA thioesterase [unclassified Luteococcus]|uniref:acyl-CoA thioesterase n=1 Tax=unclassified Luteococcus TaxID=2639923 RepID=UPI00313B5D83
MQHPVATLEVPIRWTDLDLQGHVNNTLVAEYLQEARTALLAGGPNAHMLGGGILVAGHSVEYRRSIHFGAGPLLAEVGVYGVGASLFHARYELLQEGQICARASTRLCPFDFERQAPRRLTDQERGWFREVADEAPEMRPLTAPALEGRGHVHEFLVRWGDVDRYGHVNNVRHFDYVQEARIAATTAADPGMSRDGGEVRWVVARQDVDYLHQISHRMEPYAVHTAVTAIGRTSYTLAAEIVDPQADGQVLARARTVQVCTDAAGAKRELPDSTREGLGSLLVS